MAKKHRPMPPALKAYWAKKRAHSGRRPQRARSARRMRRSVVHMARYRRYHRSGGGGGFGRKIGGFSPVFAGVAENVVNNFIPIGGVGTTAVGYLMKDQFSKNLGMYQIGYSLGGMIPNLTGGLFGGTSSAGGNL